jgi:hypothetical protein
MRMLPWIATADPWYQRLLTFGMFQTIEEPRCHPPCTYIYKVALTADEAQTIHDRGYTTAECPDMSAHWSCRGTRYVQQLGSRPVHLSLFYRIEQDREDRDLSHYDSLFNVMGLKYQTPSFVTLAACGCVVAVMYGVSYTRCPRNTVMGVYSGGNNLVRVLYPRGATWAPCNAAGQYPRDNIFVWPIVNKCRSLCMDPITVDVSISTFTLCAKHVQAKGSFTVAVGLSPSARLKSSDSEFDKSCQMALQKLALTRPSGRSERGYIVSEMVYYMYCRTIE